VQKRSIGAVTFDLWDCLFIDDSDEPKRKAAGLPTKRVARRDLAHEYFSRHHDISRAMSDVAFDVCEAAFNKVWHDQYVTWTVRERYEMLMKALSKPIPEPDLSEVIRKHETMELDYRPDPVPRACEALRALKGVYPLVIISDAINSPGWALRELLKGVGMFDCFDAFVFSDEAGRSKPAPEVFQAAATAVGCEMRDIVHIGDRPHNDIGGPHAVGARGVLLTAAKQRPLGEHQPDAVCDDYAKLPEILKEMNA
jgi:putative hydrolase of the HAD superfamily